MKLVDAPPASGPDPRAVANLAEEDARMPVAQYFFSFRWEPPAIDPETISASAFLAMLDDAPAER